MTHSQQGYLILAVDDQKYVDMAKALAMSIRIFDKRRPIAIVFNPRVYLDSEARELFQYHCKLDLDPDLKGVLCRLRFYAASPFFQTMAVDADCIMVKQGVDYYWNLFQGHDFNMLGAKTRTGLCHEVSVEFLCQTFSLPYFVSGNAGVFYFEKTMRSKEMFSDMLEIRKAIGEDLLKRSAGRSDEVASEPIIGTVLGKHHVEPLHVDWEIGSLMVSTWRARRYRFNIDAEISYLEKPSGFYFNFPLKPFTKKWIAHSPIFAHFVGREPKRIYDNLVEQVRKKYHGS